MPALNFETLATPLPLKAHSVPVPEFGPEYVAWIAELSADERDGRLEIAWLEYQKARGDDSQVGFRSWVVAACLCTGPERNFVAASHPAILSPTMLSPELVRLAVALGPHSSKPVTRMFSKAAEVNALSPEQIEELEKN